MRLVSAAGFALASFLTVARADYVGCVVSNTNPPPFGPSFVPRAGQTSDLACQTACRGSKYSLYQPTPFPDRFACYCAPAGTDLRGRIFVSSTPDAGTPNSTPRECTNTRFSYRTKMLATTFVFDGCYSRQSGFAGAPVQRTDITTNDACATTCRWYTYMAFLAVPPINVATCYCSNALIWTVASATCDAGVILQSQHTLAQASAGLERRRARRKQAEQALLAAQPCPGNLVACRTHRDNEDDYECLDTSSELESCGGCVNGYWGSANATSLAGENCSNLAGVLSGGVTCAAGQCKVFTCRQGYTLVDGRCEVSGN